MAVALLLAQSTADAVSGGAGWLGAGLLGAVLFWLLYKHLPAKDDQINAFIEGKDRQVAAVTVSLETRIDAQRKEFTEALTTLTAEFRREASAERQACEKHYATLAATMNEAFRTLGDQLRTTSDQQKQHSERNQQWIELLKQQVEKERKAAP